MSDWRPIETAPKDGTPVKLGWLPNWPTLEFVVHSSAWRDGKWEGGWTPTHWMPKTPNAPAGREG